MLSPQRNDVRLLSLYLFWWRHFETSSHRLFSKFFSLCMAICSFLRPGTGRRKRFSCRFIHSGSRSICDRVRVARYKSTVTRRFLSRFFDEATRVRVDLTTTKIARSTQCMHALTFTQNLKRW